MKNIKTGGHIYAENTSSLDMTNQNKKIKEEFEKKFPLIMLSGNMPLSGDYLVFGRKEIWKFIEKSLDQQRKEMVKEIVKSMEQAGKKGDYFFKEGNRITFDGEIDISELSNKL